MTDTFTSVDLSKLPAPDIVEQLNYETIFTSMLATLQSLDPQFNALTESEPAYKILQVAAYRELLVRQKNNEACRAVMLAYATGADLDQLGVLLGVYRLQISAGDPMQSIPPTMESDIEFRRRIQLAPEGFSVAGPEGAYVFHALSADGRVLDASATSPSPGEVVVTVLSRNEDGSAPPDLVEAVAAVLSQDNVRPMTDHVTVQGAEILPYAVNAEIYTYAGPDSTLVMQASLLRLQTYISESHRLGRDVPVSGLYSVMHSEGVQRVVLHAPVVDVVVDRTQAAYCTSIELTHAGIDE